MDQLRITELIEKVKANTASEAEIRELDLLYLEYDRKPGYTDLLNKTEKQDYRELIFSHIQKKVSLDVDSQKSVVSKRQAGWLKIAIAAVILITVSSVAYLHYFNSTPEKEAGQKIAEIKPGGNKAILTLSDGRQIALTDARNGNLANENNTAIEKTKNGQVVYLKDKRGDAKLLSYNTMATPAGGQYNITLSDGTKVLLNATSSLKYPVSFSGVERKVELSGEAYFEVAHDRKKTFQVVTKNQVIEVLGTQFNINSYADEIGTKTVLVQGSVKIYTNSEGKMLKPGQQSVMINNKLKIEAADIEETLAWKNGYFRFNNESIKSIMRKLSRWYNIEVEYNDHLPELGFYGTISRFKNITEVLKMLEYTKGVHFKVEGRRVIVMP